MSQNHNSAEITAEAQKASLDAILQQQSLSFLIGLSDQEKRSTTQCVISASFVYREIL
jgi:hypothetical protein